MTRHNTTSRYGAVTKGFHWLTVLMIFTMFPLGLVANELAQTVRDGGGGEALLARTALLFSLHKTLGITVFFVALARIAWALGQPKPGLLNGDEPLEARLAETVHWLLYGSLVLVPLSGWVHHATTTGFAPIWWPFGQSLPFIPKSEALAAPTATLHYLLQWVLAGAIALHVAGALKHHVIDGDATLRRMLPGDTAGQPTAQQPGHVLPFLAALAVWAAVLGGAAGMGWFTRAEATRAPVTTDQTADQTADQTTAQTRAAADGNWQVETGELSLVVTQMGSDISGRFSDWSAEITYDETADAEGRHGAVTVEIRISSLTLGSVTDQALGAEYLAAETHPSARFTADLITRDGQKIAVGNLTIRDNSVPVEMPFDLQIEGDTVQASGGLEVDRRDFGIGLAQEGSLGATVTIAFDLTASRAEGG